MVAFAAHLVSPQNEVWHERLAHMAEASLLKLKTMSTGITPMPLNERFCETCAATKLKEKPHKGTLFKGEKRLEALHIDVVGHIRNTGLGGEEYWITIVDGATGFCWALPIEKKSDLFGAFRDFLALHERPEIRCRHIHLDKGGENSSLIFELFCTERGITLCYTDTEQHESNGLVERYNGILMEWLRAVLHAGQIKLRYWPVVLTTGICTLLNYRPLDRIRKTPYEAWHLEKPDLSHLRVLGSRGFYKLPSAQRPSKLEPPTERCQLLGYKGHSSYVILTPSGRVTTTPNAVFDEHSQAPLLKRKLERLASASDEHGGDKQRKTAQPLPKDTTPLHSPLPTAREPPRSPLPTAREELPEASNTAPTTQATRTAEETTQTAPNAIPAPQPPRFTRTSPPVQECITVQTPDGPSEVTIETHEVDPATLQRPELRLRRSSRVASREVPSNYVLAATSQVQHFAFHSMVAFLGAVAHSAQQQAEPRTLQEALRHPHWYQWKQAMGEEKSSLVYNKTWTLVPPPVGRKVLKGKWVYKLKRGPNGEVLRYKARWVVKGFLQREGIDFHDTFASVVKPMSYKAIFALAAALDLEIHQMDVKTAFLYGEVEEEIYVEQPPGLDDAEPDLVCKLNKALYGLKQSPRVWYQTLSRFLEEIGWKPLFADSGVFTKDGHYLAVYVDDLLIAGPSLEEIKKIKHELATKFEMTDLGECRYYLGMTVERDRPNRTIRLGQKAYLEKILREFGFWDKGSVGTPMETSPPGPAPDDYTPDPAMASLYSRAIGSLMYAMLGTRPDIAFAVSYLSRHLAKPTEHHIRAVERVFRYLRGTVDLELVFRGNLQPLAGWCDADYGGDVGTRRSTTGYVFHVGSAPISWSSKRQTVVALSTCEAELMAQTQAAKEAIWLRTLLEELGTDTVAATIIWSDNQGAIAVSKDPQSHSRAKHIDIQNMWVREAQREMKVDIRYTPTGTQVADGLTKPLPKPLFVEFRRKLGLESR